MKKFFSIGEAAKAAHTTSETLRHYDRIGLVKPSKKDEWTNYRYYTEQDIVRLNTVRALQLMGLSLQEIKEALAYEDLEQVINFLAQAEKKADEKIAALQYSKSKIALAKTDYERKLQEQQKFNSPFLRSVSERVILLSDRLETPTLDNLWNYLSHFYAQIPPALKEQFAFEDSAGIYTENGSSKLFAVCVRHQSTAGLKVLPEGRYLCAECSEENRKSTLDELIHKAQTAYGADPAFTLQLIRVSGILHWNYEIQIYLDQ